MLNKIGTSGEVSLGKRFAGQLFDVIFYADGRVEMLPMRSVAAARRTPVVDVTPVDGWVPPGGYGTCNTWALENREALEAYAASVKLEGTAAEQMQEFIDTSSAACGRPPLPRFDIPDSQ
jgi:hypothetical protein